jgi:Glycosyltransferase family 87
MDVVGSQLRAIRPVAAQLRDWCSRHRRAILLVLIAAMAVEATGYLLYELWRLLLEHGWKGATDLGHRLRETHSWFAGQAVYGRISGAVYPPATYLLLWPFVGWIGLGTARWLWALPTLAGLAWLVILVLRESRPGNSLERTAIVLALLATYATGQTIGNGQLPLVVLPLLLAALLALRRPSAGLRADLLVALPLVGALVKVIDVLPFLVVAAVAPWRKRPLVLAAVAYAGLTLVAAAFQRPSLASLIRQWLKAGSSAASARISDNYGNVHAWLSAAGLKAWILPLSGLILVALAYWGWRHRSVDRWILIGVAAYVSRLWTYHRSYDDLLIVLPIVALFRIATESSKTRELDVTAVLLLAATLAVMLVPGGLYGLPAVLRSPFTSLEAAVWLAGLGFLLVRARASRLHGPIRENDVQWTSSSA